MGVRMHNRKLGVPALFSGVLTGKDVTGRGFPRVRTCATGSWVRGVSCPFFGFPRFFLTTVVVQNVFEKIRENVLRILGLFPVLLISRVFFLLE